MRRGDVIAGRYAIESMLGRGAMGAVYAAQDGLVGTRVAVKVMNAELDAHPTLPERFKREAFAAARLEHPNCVRVLDAGHDADHGPFLVMPLLQGRTLGAAMTGPFAVDRTLELVSQILAGLSHAHERGFVHRDIKPDNVFIERDERGAELAKIVDFGLVKFVDVPGTRPLTRMGSVFGTPQYMAPEQASGGRVDARADLYAVGATMYEMLSGRPPIEAESFAGILRAHVMGTRAPLPARVPAAVADFVNWLLSTEARDRPQSAREALEHLQALRTGATVARRARVASPSERFVHPAAASAARPQPAGTRWDAWESSPSRLRVALPDRPESNLPTSSWPGRLFAGVMVAAAAVVGVLALGHAQPVAERDVGAPIAVQAADQDGAELEALAASAVVPAATSSTPATAPTIDTAVAPTPAETIEANSPEASGAIAVREPERPASKEPTSSRAPRSSAVQKPSAPSRPTSRPSEPVVPEQPAAESPLSKLPTVEPPRSSRGTEDTTIRVLSPSRPPRSVSKLPADRRSSPRNGTGIRPVR